MNLSVDIEIEKENKRVEALKAYNIMDTPPEMELDEISKIAFITCETPISLISLLDHTRQWFKSNHGLKACQTSKEDSFCQYTIENNDLLIVEDSLEDDRFKSNPHVLGYPFIRFYAGMPLSTPAGYNIGTLCIIDIKPRNLSDNQKFVLKALAKQVMMNFELRKQNEELAKLNEKTQKLIKAKEEFFSNMSHELRTPLNAISGFTENLFTTKLDPEQKEQLGIIHSSVNILISLVNDILDYSKIDSGSLKIENRPFNLITAVKKTHELLKIKADEKNLSFVVNINEAIPRYINGDKVRLNQILINLIGNAIKFTSKGSVTLGLDILNNEEEEIELVFSVKDTGIGIPSTNLNLIFDRFQQVEDTTRVYGGTGLGLSISKSLVELQNGKLEVKSELGKGSEFTFSIKFQKSNQEEIKAMMEIESSHVSTSKPNFKNIKVLLAEDNIINVKLIQKILEGTGMHLDVSENGRVCVEKLKENNYDIILMDVNMPEMDGYQATRCIRNTLNLDTPIIGLSANISEKDREKCVSEGMNDFVTKPFKINELLTVISKLSKLVINGNESSEPIKKANISQSKINSFSTTKNSHSNKIANSKYLPIVLSLESMFKAKYKKPKSFLQYNTEILLPRKIINSDEFENSYDTLNLKYIQDYCGNDEEFQKQMIDLFIIEITQELENLEEEILQKNFEAIKNISHKIKSPLGVFGLFILKNQFNKIEELSSKSDVYPILKSYIKCRNNLDQILIDLKTPSKVDN